MGNWIVLEAGLSSFYDIDKQDDNSGSDAGHILGVQKNIEMRRLQLELEKYGRNYSAARNIKFLGCAMESVRSSLAEFFHRIHVVSYTQDSDLAQFDWNPPIPSEKFEMASTISSAMAFEKLIVKKKIEEINEKGNNLLRCLHMRVL